MKTGAHDLSQTRPVEAAQASNTTPSIREELCGVSTVIVAIHGIGNQRRSDTVRSVARGFAASLDPSLPEQALGFFQLGDGTQVRLSKLPVVTKQGASPSVLDSLRFAEVYWADIPRGVVDAKDTLEETKNWAKSVVSRAEAMYKQVNGGWLEEQDFRLGSGVIEEIIEAIAVLENLLFLADKAGLFRFDLGTLLRDYLDDVQVVTEFSSYRAQIVGRFHRAMHEIVDAFSAPNHDGPPNIYIVAHSEGTVVSFLAMLQALASDQVECPKDGGGPKLTVSTKWIKHVRGYMTLGSPLDKHIALWDGLWKDLGKEQLSRAKERGPCNKIQWRNYYDYGDPIGFKLDGTIDFLSEVQCDVFEFTKEHNFGYSRSWMPGKAHIDYWNDDDVFEHFLAHVVGLPGDRALPRAPKTSHWKGAVSTAVPYFASALLHFAGVFVLFKSIVAFSGEEVSRMEAARITAPPAMLLIGVTVAARLPRLVAKGAYNLYWPLLAFFLFGCGACAYSFGVSDSFKGELSCALSWLLPPDTQRWRVESLPILLAALVAVSGWLVPRKPRWARRVLLGSGILLIGGVAATRLRNVDSTAPLWPVFVGGAAFLYLWWLAILLFDLSFVWHRYIRWAVGPEALNAWRKKEPGAASLIRTMLGARRGKRGGL